MKRLAVALMLMFALWGNSAKAQNTDNSSQQRLAQLKQVGVGFASYVFSGEKFPTQTISEIEALEKTLGKIEVKTEFFDKDGTPVQNASLPGRYGAVTELKTVGGERSFRYATLFRQKEKVGKWWETEMQGQMNFPAEIGIEPKVAKEQSKYIADSFRNEFFESMIRKPQTAILLSGLYETKPGEKQVERNSPYERDRHYWYTLRKKRGDTPEYKYLTSTPKDYARQPDKKYPLMVFLHGSGERGEDLPRVRVHGPLTEVDAGRDLPFVVIAPQCPVNEDWYSEEVYALIEEVCTKYRIDRSQIYLTGLSMGGYGTWSTAIAYPELFAAIAPMCGGSDPRDAARLKKLPIWNFHGKQDEAVPFHESEDMVSAVKKAGGDIKFTIYPDLGHNCWTISYANPELYTWLLSHRKK